ncbi:MAG TPA: DUF4352 domain-containing protein [Candidatus Acidoferrales bacterium]|nr:DUF4352 domain-containing protein [Candidatus Acidoferrales bacterium]
METGLYITFFETREPFDRALPPVGPLEHVVVRRRDLVAHRRAGHAPEVGGDVARFLEAELEFQRAIGHEPGGPKRSEMRFAARDGVLLRFVSYDDGPGQDPPPELGPFAVVTVGRDRIEADGQPLAERGASDIAFRTPSTGYHPRIVAPASSEIVVPPPLIAPEPPAVVPPVMIGADEPRPPAAFARDPAAGADTPALAQRDLDLIEQRAADTLRERVLEQERRRLVADVPRESTPTRTTRHRPRPATVELVPAGPEPRAFEIGPALWRMRFAIIGVLLLLAGVYTFTVIRGGGAATVSYVNLTQRFSSDLWGYVVTDVQRSTSAGAARPRGVYYVVRVGVTNKGTEGAQLSPSQFVLVDADAVEHGAESVGSNAYRSSRNPSSQLIWPDSFPVGTTVTLELAFDVDASLPRGNLLRVSDLPNVRVRLD